MIVVLEMFAFFFGTFAIWCCLARMCYEEDMLYEDHY